MSTVSFTNLQFLAESGGDVPCQFNKGQKVVFSEITLPEPIQKDLLQILRELGKIFQRYSCCLSDIPFQAVTVVDVNPFSFIVNESFTMRSANRENWLFSPQSHFSYRKLKHTHHFDTICRKNHSVDPLPSITNKFLSDKIENVSYQGHDGVVRTFYDMLIKTGTDAIIVLHEGKILYEKYFNGHQSDDLHLEFSVTKSVVGTIVSHLIFKKILNPDALVSEYIPELKETAFGDAQVIDILDMTTGIHYNEEYTNPESEIRRQMISYSFLHQPDDYPFEKTARTFLKSLKKEGEHGKTFHYVSANTDILSWLVENATQMAGHMQTVNELVTELVWSKLGTESDAIIMKDSVNVPTWAGGLNATSRDMARFGLMILNQGKANNQRLFAPEVFEIMRQRDRRPHFERSSVPTTYHAMKGWSYANQFWWTENEHGAFSAIGIYGQVVYIDPKAKMVIVKNSSHPEPEDQWTDSETFIAMHAMGKHLLKHKIASSL